MKFEELTLRRHTFVDAVVEKLHIQGKLVARIVRDFDSYNLKFDESNKSSIVAEFKNYRSKKNLKHSGSHFAATLLLKGKQIQLYKSAIGVLIHGGIVDYKAFYEGDAGDDYGVPQASVKKHSSLASLGAFLKNKSPLGIQKYLQTNEVQPYISDNSVLGIVVEMDRVSTNPEEEKDEVARDNCLQYAKAVYLKLFLKHELDLDLRLYCYSCFKGEISPATLDERILKECIRQLNIHNEMSLDLDSIDKTRLLEVNKRIVKKLDVSFTDTELKTLVDESLLSSIKYYTKNVKESFEELRNEKVFPKESTLKEIKVNGDVIISIPKTLAAHKYVVYYSKMGMVKEEKNDEVLLKINKDLFENIPTMKNHILENLTGKNKVTPGPG